jgi:ammonia channel protein AmtB
VFPNPFPAILIGFICGILVTFLNTKKRGLNENGVIDSLGSISVFLVPSLIGAIYSAILFASSPYGPDNSDNYVQMEPSLNRFRQGGYQLAGLIITILIALATGALIGVLMKLINTTESP